jgi:hypothetical protein
MPDHRRKRCRECGGHESEVGAISWTGLCIEDAVRLQRENDFSIAAKQGVGYRRWLIGTVRAAVGDPRLVQALDKIGAFPSVDEVTTTK